MGYFKNLSNYRSEIMRQLIQNPNIVKAVGDTSPDFDTNNTKVNANNLLYKNIYPTKRSWNISSDESTYINIWTISNANGEKNNQKQLYRSFWVIFDIYTHKELLKTDNVGSRVDYIASEIEEMITAKRMNFSLKSPVFDEHQDMTTDNGDYVGMRVLYYLQDVNISC